MGDIQFQIIKINNLHPESENYHYWINVLSEMLTHNRNEDKSEDQIPIAVEDVRPDVEFIARQESSFVIAQDLETKAYVGYGILVPDIDNPKSITFADAFVLPEFRRNGVFSRLTDIASEIAQERGFERILAIPTVDGESRRVLERKGYMNTTEVAGVEALVKPLGLSGQEYTRGKETNHPNSLR